LWDADRPSFEVSCAAAFGAVPPGALCISLKNIRAAAVIAPAADYAADAARILEDLAPARPAAAWPAPPTDWPQASYNLFSMAFRSLLSDPCAQERCDAPAHRLTSIDLGNRHRSSPRVLFGSRRFMARSSRRDAVRSERSAQPGFRTRFVLPKGHAAPILYAAWAEAGAFDRADS